MKRILSIIAILLAPATALALDFTNVSTRYADAPFPKPEAAAISLLTNIGAVSGNPDGTFQPGRPVNRAEFLKIILLSNTSIFVSPSDAATCFPDVRSTDWFSSYVCLAKRRTMVGGYPDGLFHPERQVNYAEALKMLGAMYGLVGQAPEGSPWYQVYLEGATEAGVALTWNPPLTLPLTRGDVSRLTAAYVASMENELELYRDAERGIIHSSSSQSSVSSSLSSSSVSTSHSSSSTSSSTQGSSSSSVVGEFTFPARSQFLVTGQRSNPVASSEFFANLEPTYIQGGEVKLKNKIEGIDAMYIVDTQGTELGRLYLDKIYDATEKTWRGTFTSKNYLIPKGEARTLGLEIRMKEYNQGGTSDELVQVDTFKVTTLGDWSQEGGTSTALGPFPKHQTSYGRITAVFNALDPTGILPIGQGQLLAGFTIQGAASQGVTLKVEHLEFQMTKNSDVTIQNWQLGTPDSSERMNCSVSDSTVSCLSIPESLGTIGSGSRTLRLFGDVSLAQGANSKGLQISLVSAGDTSTNGAVRWTDGSGHFNWVDEIEQPLARSTNWK